MSSIPGDLAAFLVEAKQRTYAGLDDDATVSTPVLAGSKQLEHRAPPYAYRDIYFGMGFFCRPGDRIAGRARRLVDEL